MLVWSAIVPNIWGAIKIAAPAPNDIRPLAISDWAVVTTLLDTDKHSGNRLEMPIPAIKSPTIFKKSYGDCQYNR